MSLPLREELASMLAALREDLDDLERGVRVDQDGAVVATGGERTPSVFELLVLLSAARADGYPRQSGRPGAARSAFDENGEPLPLASDPTGETAVDPQSSDPMHRQFRELVKAIAIAAQKVRFARGTMIRAGRFGGLRPAEPGCTSCETIGVWTAVEHNARCRWCYDFWLAQGVDAPVELLRARKDGKRITQPMVDAALARTRRGKRVTTPTAAARASS